MSTDTVASAPTASALPAQPHDVMTVGEPLILFAATQPGPLLQTAGFHRTSAGAELNVAIGLARMGFGVSFVGRVGADSMGRWLLELMATEGIDRSAVAVDRAHRTGFMLKARTDDGSDPEVEYHRCGSAGSRVSLADLPSGHTCARHLHLTGIAPALSAASRELVLHMAGAAQKAGQRLSFDPNLRPALWPSTAEMVQTVNRIAGHSDLVLPGLAEGRLLSGYDSPEDIARHFLGLGAAQVIVKLGAHGALCADRGGGFHRLAAVPVAKVVDTVGAGDGFAVGVISALLEGDSLIEAGARGNAIGARVVQFPGDADGLPTRAQLLPDRPAPSSCRLASTLPLPH